MIVVIVDPLTKMVQYKPVKVTINILKLAKIIINMIVHHYGLLNFIINDCGAIFMSKFKFLL